MKLSDELNKRYGRQFKKAVYFMMKNKLSNTKTDYSKMTLEEFVEKYCDGDAERLLFFEQWERSPDYANLINLMLMENATGDLLEIYNAVRDKAVTGDNQAIKTYLMLQKEIEQRLKQYGKAKNEENQEDEDDGLTLD